MEAWTLLNYDLFYWPEPLMSHSGNFGKEGSSVPVSRDTSFFWLTGHNGNHCCWEPTGSQELAAMRSSGTGAMLPISLRFCHVSRPSAMLDSILGLYMKITAEASASSDLCKGVISCLPRQVSLGYFPFCLFRNFSAFGRLYSRKVFILGNWGA